MSLAVEYLIRTGAIREMLETPCSLFLTGFGSNAKLIVTIDEESQDAYLIRHWDVGESTSSLPYSDAWVVSKSELFSSKKVIVPGFVLPTYDCNPITARHNKRSRPMEADIHDTLYFNHLNSASNQKKRVRWLWRCFFPSQTPKAKVTDVLVFDEMRRMREFRPERYTLWTRWQALFMRNNVPVATELVFKSEYDALLEDSLVNLLTEFTFSRTWAE